LMATGLPILSRAEYTPPEALFVSSDQSNFSAELFS
jgi:hypothetical protein